MNYKTLFNIQVFAAIFSCLFSSTVSASATNYQVDYRYNIAKHKTGIISPDPDGDGPLKRRATRFNYNTVGLLSSVEHGELSMWKPASVQPKDWGADFTVFTSEHVKYDSWGREVSRVYRVGTSNTIQNITQFAYDSVGRKSCEMVRMATTLASNPCVAEFHDGVWDRVTQYHYNLDNDITSIEKAVGTPLEQTYADYSYAYRGVKASVTDANGNLTKYDYDGLGRLRTLYMPSPDSQGQYNSADYERYGYDANGNLTSIRKRSGVQITQQFDNLNQHIGTLYSSGVTDTRKTFDNAGNMTQALFAAGALKDRGIIRKYDGFGNLISVTNNIQRSTRTLAFEHDAHGNETGIIFPDNERFTYTYDGLDRLTSIKKGETVLHETFYHRNGKIGGQKRNAGKYLSVFDYKGHHLSQISHYLNTQEVTFDYSFNLASQINAKGISNPLFRHLGENEAVAKYHVNGLNQYTCLGDILASCTTGKSVTYDLQGNMENDQVNEYTYDPENRLKTVTGEHNASILYDPMGRLWRVTANGITTEFLFYGDRLVAEYQDDNLVKRYLHGQSVDKPLIGFSGSSVEQSAMYYFHSDHQNSVVSLSAADDKSDLVNTYDAYGIPGSSNNGRFGYTGQLNLHEIGLSYYKARIYHPKLGRFLQTDPVGYEDQMNLYTYVHNDPVNLVDPTGEAALFGALISAAIEIGVQSVHVSKGGSFDVGKIVVSAAAGAIGVGLGAKAQKLASLLSNGNKVAKTGAQFTGAVTEAVGTNVFETSINNAVNSITGEKEMESINAQGAATNAALNTTVGNIADNKIGKAGTKKADLIKGAFEGARKELEAMNKANEKEDSKARFWQTCWGGDCQ